MVSDHRRAGPDIKLLAGRKLFRGSFHRLANREGEGGKERGRVLKDFERWSPRPANFVVAFFFFFFSFLLLLSTMFSV